MRALMLLVLLVSPAAAQSPLTIVAPAAPGGGWDQMARTMARVLEAEGLAGSVQVENIPGAAGTVGLARFVSGRRGDANALLVTGLVMVGGIVQNASPVSLRDATPIARLLGEYEAIAVPAGSPHRTLSDLVAAWRVAPGAIAWGGGSAGGTDQILVDLLATRVGIAPGRTNYVAFAGGGEARTALLGAQVQVGVSGLGEFAELARAGRVRILAVSSGERLAGWDVPTIRESGFDVVLANWRGVVAPPGLPRAARQRLESMMAAMQLSSRWQEELRQRGWEPLALGSEAFGRFAESETRRVQGLVAQRERGELRAAGSMHLARWFMAILVLSLVIGLRHRSPWPAARRPRALALIICGIALNTVLAERLGFIVGGALLFACTAFAFGEVRRGRVLVVSLAFSAAVFLVFRVVLSVTLPAGTLWTG